MDQTSDYLVGSKCGSQKAYTAEGSHAVIFIFVMVTDTAITSPAIRGLGLRVLLLLLLRLLLVILPAKTLADLVLKVTSPLLGACL